MATTTVSGPLVATSGFTGDVTGNVTGNVNDVGIQKISETVGYGDFTDGGSTAGTYDLTETIPIGALFLGSSITGLTGFTGDTSAVITVGDGSDADRYNTGTPSVFTTAANGIELGLPSGDRYHDAAATVTLTVTSGSDFTSVSAGELTIEMFYVT